MSKRSTFLFSVRRSYLQLLFKLIGLPFLPTYNDAQFKYKIKFNPKHELSFIGLGAYDQFKLNLAADTNADNKFILGQIPKNGQWNYTNGLVYRWYRERGFMTAVLSRNMLRNTSKKYLNDIETPDRLLLNYGSDEIENKFRVEYTTPNPFRLSHQLRRGGRVR